MKIQSIILATVLTFGASAWAYEGPSPLLNIKIDFSLTQNSSNQLYSYKYKVTNPKSNDGKITSFDINLPRNPQKEVELAYSGLTHCSAFSRISGPQIFAQKPIVAVGSTAPSNWNCGYTLQNSGGYGWGPEDSPFLINPGSTLGGFSLISLGLPGIRDAVVEPAIYYDQLPSKYEDPDVMKALDEKVKWTGKTIGPVAPPKIFVADDFLTSLIALKDQSLSLGWIKEKGVAMSLDAKLNEAKRKISKGELDDARHILHSFLNEVHAQNGKHITPEAYALLYFNAKYLIDHLPEKSKHHDKDDHHDKDRDHKDRD